MKIKLLIILTAMCVLLATGCGKIQTINDGTLSDLLEPDLTDLLSHGDPYYEKAMEKEKAKQSQSLNQQFSTADIPIQQRFTFTTEKEHVATLYFGYNSENMTNPQEIFNIIEKAKEREKVRPINSIVVEGHCDERGTESYNMALGERRALTVRGALSTQGIDSNRIHPISYGELQPAVDGTGESAWKWNRRVEVYFE